MKTLLFSTYLLLLQLMVCFAQKDAPKPYGAVPSAQQLDWQKLQTYGFIHFGINTFTDKEWGYGDESESLFNPKNFDAEQIVRTFKNAGFKGVILTCKHHDGFCLWPTKTTEHNISKSPWRNGKGDLVREISDACKKYGLKFGVYLSPWDRNASNYGTPEYVQMYKAQLTELLTNYGEVFETWHDGANGGDGFYGGAKETRKIDRSVYYNWPDVWQMINKLQPKAVIFGDIGKDVRWVGNESGFAGDPCWATFTPESIEEGKTPSNGTVKYWLSVNGTRNGKYWMPAETDFSIRPGWFWHQKENNKVKSSDELLKHYFMSVGRGASMLLNVPPDNTGRIFKEDSLQMIGFGQKIQAIFGHNLAAGAKFTASNIRGKSNSSFGPQNLNQEHADRYWATDDEVVTPELNMHLPKPQTFNIIRLRENTALGQRIDSVSITALIGQKWVNIANTSSIGINKLIRLTKNITAQDIKLQVVKAQASTALSDFSLFFEANNFMDSAVNAIEIKQYIANSKTWKISNSKNGALAFDGKANTVFKSNSNQIMLNFGKLQSIKFLNFTPSQQFNDIDGLVSHYQIQISNDGKKWKTIKNDEFANIQSNPITQSIYFEPIIKTRYLKFIATKFIKGKQIRVAELGIIEY